MQKRFFTALLVIMLFLFLTACSPGGIVVSSETPEPALTAVPTPTPTSTPSPMPTVEPTPTPIPQKAEAKAGIKKGRDKVEAEVNQRFQDFLNGTGEFTDEKILEKGFVSSYVNTSDLGCFVCNGEICAIQGIPLCYKKIDQGEVFAFGTKNKSGNRIITLVELPSQSYIDHNLTVDFPIYPDRFQDSAAHIRSFSFSRTSDYYNFLNSCIGKFSYTYIDVCISSEVSSYNEWPDGYKKVSTESIDPKISINRTLMTDIYFVDNDDHYFISNFESAKEFYNSTPESIITVTNFNEFESLVDTCYDQIPCCAYFGFMSLD